MAVQPGTQETHMIRTRHLLLVLALALPACLVSGRGSMQVRSSSAVVYQEPPPPQAEVVSQRPGFVWVSGRWDWRGGQWVWIGGHWERERAGYAWNQGRWNQNGNQWVWVEGSWGVNSSPPPDTSRSPGGVAVSGPTTTTTVVTQPPPDTSRSPGGVAVSGGGTVVVSAYPTAAPPPLRAESAGSKAGFVWIAGRWDWRNGNWAWVDGHWERERANQAWAAGRWELQGNRWVWIEGSWQVRAQPAPGPKVRDHRSR